MSVVNFNGALKTYLLADITLSALIGNKFYALLASQKATLPFCTFQKISTQTIDNIVSFDNVVIERWQIDCYGSTMDSVEAIKKAVFDRLHKKLYLTMSNYFVHAINCINELPINEPTGDGTSEYYERISLDFSIKRNYNTTT